MGEGIRQLKTERLRIRALRENDVDAVFSFFGNAANLEHFPAPFTREEVSDFVSKNGDLTRGCGLGFQAVVLKSTGELIGDCGITIQNIDGIDEHEIGYYFHMAHWGNGYATEAAQCLKEFGFETLGLKRLCSYMAEDHHPSRRVAERNGMKLGKTFNNPNNRNLPTTVYAISHDQS